MEGGHFRQIIGFHCQHAVEKYLKALLVRHQIEFPRTHDIRKLLSWVAGIDSLLAEALDDTDALTPFGVAARYPGDMPEMLPDGEIQAIQMAHRTREAVMERLGAYLAEG